MKFKILILFFCTFPFIVFAQDTKKCVYINSYHQGFPWSDAISRVIQEELKDTCELTIFNMDTKRNNSVDFMEKQALKAKKIIEEVNPDIVLTSDDHAAKFLIVPYFKNSKIPFLFCGINWTAKEYGFPFKNVRGMIEVNPIKALYNIALKLTHGKKAIFIGDDTLTDKKDFEHLQKYAKKENILLDGLLINTVKDWKKSYLKAQDTYDFIILGHNSTIKGWNDKDIKTFFKKNNKKLTLTTYSWMMPYSMIGVVIRPEEQGEWITQSAKAILDGYLIENISITTNKTWVTIINQDLLKSANIILPRDIVLKSTIYNIDK